MSFSASKQVCLFFAAIESSMVVARTNLSAWGVANYYPKDKQYLYCDSTDMLTWVYYDSGILEEKISSKFRV